MVKGLTVKKKFDLVTCILEGSQFSCLPFVPIHSTHSHNQKPRYKGGISDKNVSRNN